MEKWDLEYKIKYCIRTNITLSNFFLECIRFSALKKYKNTEDTKHRHNKIQIIVSYGVLSPLYKSSLPFYLIILPFYLFHLFKN